MQISKDFRYIFFHSLIRQICTEYLLGIMPTMEFVAEWNYAPHEIHMLLGEINIKSM